MDTSDLHFSLDNGAVLTESPNDGVREYSQCVAPLVADFDGAPQELFVRARGGQSCYSGSYVILPGNMSQGFPVWRHRGGSRRLYVGIDGHWCIGDEDPKDPRSVSRRIFSPSPHGGALPTCASAGKWYCFDDTLQKGTQDVDILVSSLCEWLPALSELHVAPSAQYLLFAGAYGIVDGVYANGFHVWRQAGGNMWLYTGRDGHWSLCGEEVRLLKGFATCGCISHAEAHGGSAPELATSGRWRHLDTGTRSFTEDPRIAISASPPRPIPASVHLHAPLAQQQFAGEYTLVAGDAANGFPVWQQSGGRRYLYSCPDGRWCFGEEDARRKDFRGKVGPICTAQQHGGIMPEAAGPWLRHDQATGRQLEDASLDVRPTAWWSSQPPSSFHVSCSSAFAHCTGSYDLAPAVSANGFPAWRRRGGGWWLYTTPAGQWALGPGHPRGVPAATSSAASRLCHPIPHGGSSPEVLRGRWARQDPASGGAVMDVVVSVRRRGRWHFASWVRCCRRRHAAMRGEPSGMDLKTVSHRGSGVTGVPVSGEASSSLAVAVDEPADSIPDGKGQKDANFLVSSDVSNHCVTLETLLEVDETFEDL